MPPSSARRKVAFMTAKTARHQRTRDDHASEIAEDYVEAIYEICAQQGECRAVELTKRFGVSAVTVNRTIARLQRDGYVSTKPYAPIVLTEAGEKLAQFSSARHQVVYDFLIAMGLSKSTATVDSEGIEHHVSQETLSAMKRILKNGWPKS